MTLRPVHVGALLLASLSLVWAELRQRDATQEYEDLREKALTALAADLDTATSADSRIEAGLLLLPHAPDYASPRIIRILDEGRPSAQLTDYTVDSVSAYISPRLLRKARRALQRDRPPRWALRLVSYAADPRDLGYLRSYFLSEGADPEMIEILSSYGEDALPLLMKLMHRSYEESCRAAVMISRMGDTTHYRLMEEYGEHNLCLAWTFAELEPERARPLILAHLESNDLDVRARAAYALASIKDSFYLTKLGEMLNQPFPGVALNAAYALGAYGDTSGAALIRSAARDTLTKRGKEAEYLLARLPQPLWSPVIHQLLREERGAGARRAAQAAGKLKDTSSVPYLLELMEAGNKETKRKAMEALAGMGAREARRQIKHYLYTDERFLQVGAMLALGELADTSSVGILNFMLFWEVGPRGEGAWIRHPIVDALTEIEDTAALPALALMLDEPDPWLCVKILSFFSKKASPEYLSYVEPLLTSDAFPVRHNAAAAILAMTRRQPAETGNSPPRGNRVPRRYQAGS